MICNGRRSKSKSRSDLLWAPHCKYTTLFVWSNPRPLLDRLSRTFGRTFPVLSWSVRHGFVGGRTTKVISETCLSSGQLIGLCTDGPSVSTDDLDQTTHNLPTDTGSNDFGQAWGCQIMNEYTSCSVSCKVGSSRGTSQINDIFVKLITAVTVFRCPYRRLRASSDSTRPSTFYFPSPPFPLLRPEYWVLPITSNFFLSISNVSRYHQIFVPNPLMSCWAEISHSSTFSLWCRFSPIMYGRCCA